LGKGYFSSAQALNCQFDLDVLRERDDDRETFEKDIEYDGFWVTDVTQTEQKAQ
jgi:hypothetical protein